MEIFEGKKKPLKFLIPHIPTSKASTKIFPKLAGDSMCTCIHAERQTQKPRKHFTEEEIAITYFRISQS